MSKSLPGLGDYGVTKTGGFVGWAIRKITRSPVNHAFIYIGGGRIVEAQPSGARVSPIEKYQSAIWAKCDLDRVERGHICFQAYILVGTPYNFLDIAAQAAVRLFHWKAPRRALDRLARSDRLQCAQLVDVAYHRAGVDLFKDDRPLGLVAPSDLYDLILEAQDGEADGRGAQEAA